MVRSSLLFLICLLAASCALVPEKDLILASSAPLRMSSELECMSSCLGESDETGETCLGRCF